MPNITKSVPRDANITTRPVLSTKRVEKRKQVQNTRLENEIHFRNNKRGVEYSGQKSYNRGVASSELYTKVLGVADKGVAANDNSNIAASASPGAPTYSSSCQMSPGTFGESLSSPADTCTSIITSCWAGEDNCDDNGQSNSCNQLLLTNFPTTTAAATVVSSFSSSSSASSTPHDNFFQQRRRRRKIFIHGTQRQHDCRPGTNRNTLLSWWNSPRLLVNRKKFRPIVADAVLTFMLFLAMLHLSW